MQIQMQMQTQGMKNFHLLAFSTCGPGETQMQAACISVARVKQA